MQHFDQEKFIIDGADRMMYSGEFHYFRVPRKSWRRRIRLWREAGGNVIATYVPWLIHEPEEGHFAHLDLLRRFLDVVASEKMGLIVRPGPYQYSELVNDGLPEWLLANYPQILARDIHGKPYRHSSVSYQHPLMLEKTENYFAQVCPILAEYTQAKGGPIVCTQADNELFGIHTWFSGADFNPETFGFGEEKGAYASYLRKRFKDVAVLNERYGANHRTFGEFTPKDMPAGGVARFLWNRDYFDFYSDAGINYLGTLMTLMKKYGIDGQFCHNSASPRMDSWFKGAKEALGPDFLLGSDHYFCLNQCWSQNNPTPQYFVLSFLSLEMLRLMGNPPSVLEFPFGSCSDFPDFTAQDMDAAAYLHLALGMKGLNGYVYTGGLNMPGTGVTTDVYDYNAPIGADGRRRPTYYALRRFGQFLAANPELMEAKPQDDFKVLMPWGAARGGAPGVTAPGLPGTIRPGALWENTIRQGLVTTAFAAGVQPGFVNRPSEAAGHVLVVPCDGSMEARRQKELVAFIKAGGKALFLPLLPQYDEDYKPCTILADALGFLPEGVINQELQRPRFTVGPVSNVFCNDGWARVPQPPPAAEVLGQDERTGVPVCLERRLGKGACIWVGLSWSYTCREQHRLLVWLLEQLGMERHFVKDNPSVFCTLRGNYLFLCNLTTVPRRVNVTIGGTTELVRVPSMRVLVRRV